jgi:MoaA/NifB/PqqE/SkfB family radical SAM enzyme
MYRYEDIREVHVELTTRCNASCPQCPRNRDGGEVNPSLPMAELTLEDVKELFPPGLLSQLRKLYACGNYGDPMVAQDTLDIFEHLRRSSATLELGLFTNGSGRSKTFWADLAKVVSYVRFSIDGLEDTNHLYRRGTHWPRIMESVQAFIDAGGRAEWDFIVFRHNEHQIEEARALAKQLGFSRFFVKKTSRFFSLGASTSSAQKVRDRNGSVAYTIEAPSSGQFVNPAVARLAGVDSVADYQAGTPITCKAVQYSRIYVSAEALVFPCCWTGALYPPGRPLGSAQMWSVLQKLPRGKASLDGRVTSIREIVEGPFFQELVPAGWQPRSVADGRLEPCIRACGSHETQSAQYGASLL